MREEAVDQVVAPRRGTHVHLSIPVHHLHR